MVVERKREKGEKGRKRKICPLPILTPNIEVNLRTRYVSRFIGTDNVTNRGGDSAPSRLPRYEYRLYSAEIEDRVLSAGTVINVNETRRARARAPRATDTARSLYRPLLLPERESVDGNLKPKVK